MTRPVHLAVGINTSPAARVSEIITNIDAGVSKAGGTRRYSRMAALNTNGDLILCIAATAKSNDMQKTMMAVMTGSISYSGLDLRRAHDGGCKAHLTNTAQVLSAPGIVDIQFRITNEYGEHQRFIVLADLYGGRKLVQLDFL